MNLAPEEASLEKKFESNIVGAEPERDEGKPFVGLRIARVNHDCRPNADVVYDDGARVEVLFAQRDIQPGEEVCITYHSFSSVMYAKMSDPEEDFQAIERKLFERGIICSDDCYCKDPDARKLVLEGRELNTKIKRMAGRDGTFDRIEETAKKLVVIQESLNVTPHLDRCTTYLRSCTIAIGRCKDETKIAWTGDYLKLTFETCKIIRPYSEMTKDVEKQVEDHKKKSSLRGIITASTARELKAKGKRKHKQ